MKPVLSRHPEWESAMHGAIEAHRLAPGAWGRSDCFIMVLDVIEAMTGERLFKGLRAYRSEAAGYKAFAKAGFASVQDALASVLPETGVLSARRGDACIVEGRNGLSCGIMTSAGIAVKTLNDDGTSMLRFAAVTQAVAAYRVGDA